MLNLYKIQIRIVLVLLLIILLSIPNRAACNDPDPNCGCPGGDGRPCSDYNPETGWCAIPQLARMCHIDSVDGHYSYPYLKSAPQHGGYSYYCNWGPGDYRCLSDTWNRCTTSIYAYLEGTNTQSWCVDEDSRPINGAIQGNDHATFCCRKPKTCCWNGCCNPDDGEYCCPQGCCEPFCGNGITEGYEICDSNHASCTTPEGWPGFKYCDMIGGNKCRAWEECIPIPFDCYDGDTCTENIGICHGGVWRGGACDGQQLPEYEVCDSPLDFDCDGDSYNTCCGNGVFEPDGNDKESGTDDDEECDDGNTQDGDGCSAECKNEICGDGILSGNEECEFIEGFSEVGELGYVANDYICPGSCTGGCVCNLICDCGDGELDAGEECDPPDGDFPGAQCTGPNVAEEGMVLYTKFDDDPSDGIKDSSWSGFHGECTDPGCPTLITADDALWYDLDGVDDIVDFGSEQLPSLGV